MDFVILVVVYVDLSLWNSIIVFKNIIFLNKQYYILLLSRNNHCVMKAPNRKCIRFYFIRIRVSYHSNGDDLYQQPFCIMYPIMHRCCHDNISPFRVWRRRGALCNSREGIRSAERRCVFLHWKHFSLVLVFPTALLSCSDACYLAAADELYQRRPGLKSRVSCRIF